MVAETSLGSATDFSALTRLKARVADGDSQAVRETARQFEALFLQMMLKSMRSAGSALAEPRDRTYEEMFDQQIALELAQRDSLGIADLLMRQIDAAPADSATPVSAPAMAVSVGPTGLSSRRREDFSPADEQAFVEQIWPLAQDAGASLGVDPRAIVAQAALETGWGSQQIRDSRGVSGNNLFGIKADTQWDGERIRVSTLEYEGGQFVPRQAQFRAYATLADGFAGYQEFLAGRPAYAQALEHGEDAESFAAALQSAGYATDPQYAQKISRILSSDRFERLISQAAEQR